MNVFFLFRMFYLNKLINVNCWLRIFIEMFCLLKFIWINFYKLCLFIVCVLINVILCIKNVFFF